MATDLKTVPADIMRAFAVLGLAWLDRLPTVADAISKAVHPSLALGGDGVWRPVDPEVSACYPDGLSLTEALGLTLVVRYREAVQRFEAACHGTHVAAVVQRMRGVEAFYPLGGQQWALIGDEEAVRVAGAWMVVRRAERPAIPWGPRDSVYEELRRVVHAASARLSPARVETLRPEVIASDVGRDWSAGYGGRS